jgi:hypothetical protein
MHTNRGLMTTKNAATRRQVLATLSVGAPALVLVTKTSQAVGQSATSLSIASPCPDSLAAVHAYLGPVREGLEFGGYRIVSVGAIERGGIPMTLATPTGTQFRLDVLRFDPTEGTRGIGVTGRATVFLCNGGCGETASDEASGLGAMALSAMLVERDAQGAVLPTEVRTMGERMALEPSFVG